MKRIHLFAFTLFILVSCAPSKDGDVQYEVDEKDLIPEGIAWSEKHNKFFLSSIHKTKIIEIDGKTGRVNDFIAEGEFGFLSGVGMVADDERNRLYAIGSSTSSKKRGSGLFIFDMDSRDLVKKIMTDTNGKKHFLNDLALDSNGNAYITDTERSIVYYFESAKDTLIPFIEGEAIRYPNGITLSSDNRILFIASHVNGIRIYDIASRKFLNEIDTTNISRGIDGLKYYQNTLIGVQNGFRDSVRIVQFHLNEQGDSFEKVETMDLNNSLFDAPTTGVVAGDEYYLIANSQLPDLNQEQNEIIDTSKLTETFILRYILK